MDVPPPIPPRPPGYELRTTPIANNPPLPPPPPRPSPQQQQPPQWSNGGPPPAPDDEPSQWSALFYPDGAPTPLFEKLMAAVFPYLDPQGTGYITPETLSGFLGLNGLRRDEDVWRSNLSPNALCTPEDNADSELKAACEAWYFDHKIVTRDPNRPRAPLPYGLGGMPLLSLRGLTDMMAVEHAAEPERGWRGLNAVLRTYAGFWQRLGPLPRSALPQRMPAQVERRCQEAKERGRRAAERVLEAVRVKSQIEARGRQAALDLISGPYYRYY